MSSASESDEFYDAEEISEKTTRNSGKKKSVDKALAVSFEGFQVKDKHESTGKDCDVTFCEVLTAAAAAVPAATYNDVNPEIVFESGGNTSGFKVSFETILTEETEANVRREIEKRRHKLEEARRRMRMDGDDEDALDDRSSISTAGSCSSVDYLRVHVPHASPGGSASSTGFECSQSLSGLRLPELTISSANDESSDSTTVVLQEPDLVISTKSSVVSDLQQIPSFPLPVAPPRRKRRGNPATKKPSILNTNQDKEVQGIPSPASTIESLTKEFEHCLDLPSAIGGQYVVKPQDEEKTKADNSYRNSPYVLCIEEGSIVGDLSLDDEAAMSNQLNMVLRTRTDSGKELTDIEILEQVTVLNLDTGERIPLSLAEDRLPQGVNPLSLHIMRITSEYVSNSSLENIDSDDEDAKLKSLTLSGTLENMQMKKKTVHFKRLLNRTMEKTVNKIKSVADEVYHTKQHGEDIAASECSDDEGGLDVRQAIKFKSSSSHKGPYEFNNLKLIQDLSGEHSGAVWTMKFSVCGRLLATVGQDHLLRIWVLKDFSDYFSDMRQKYNAEARLSPTPSQESFASLHSTESAEKTSTVNPEESDPNEFMSRIFAPKPFCTFTGHTADLLDVSWSKNYFILSSSMDKTVRLWHISRKECLCCFQHIDFVTAIAFHPRDDRYFLSGSLDGKLRLWNIPDKKVALWNELDGNTKLITAANFCQNGKFAVVGTYDGRCIFYTAEQLKYYTQIHVRSTRGKNAKGRKISGIEPMPGEDKILVTSNDSRVRLYDLRDLSLSCKYKGYVNLSSQIRASFSHDGKFIVTGSENQHIYLWKTQHDYTKFSSARKDRNDYWESIKVHNAVVTAAVFAPNPGMILNQMEKQRLLLAATSGTHELLSNNTDKDGAGQSPLPTQGLADGYILVTADFSGGVKVFLNKVKLNQKQT